MNKQSQSMAGLAVQMAWLVLLLGAADARAAEAAAEPTTPPAAPAAAKPEPPLQEVVVTGIRANLEKSLDVKRTAAVVLDSIDSTELGRFPDDDVADSLAHLPGVTINRTTGGEGEKVSIRGFTSEYNIVTLNNRILASDDDGRDLAFDVLPAEVITGAEVLKSQQASAVEGSIGGTVNLRVASPFTHPGLQVGVRAEGNYDDMSELHGSKYTAFVSDTLRADTLGFVLGAVHTNNNVRTDSLNAYNQNYYGPTMYPFAGGPGSVALTSTPCCITFGSIFDRKQRDALSGRLEWRPSDEFTLAADALYTRLNDPQVGYNESYYFPTDPTGTSPPWANVTVTKDTITGVTVTNFQPEMVNNTINRKVDTWLYGLNGVWKPTDRLTLGLDLYRSTSSRPEGGNDTFVTAGLVSATPDSPDILNFQDLPHSLPSINVAVPPSQLGLSTCPSGTASATNPGNCSFTALLDSGFLNNNKYWSTHYVGLNGYSVHDRLNGFNLDGSWNLKRGALDRLLFGAGYTDRAKERLDRSNDWTNGSGQYGTLYTTVGCPVQCTPYTFASQGFNVVSIVSPPNYMQGAGGSYPIALPRLNADQLLAFLLSLDGKPNPQYCTTLPCSSPFSFASTLPQTNPYNSYQVTEKSLSFYIEQTFTAPRWSGNLGVRVVNTKTTADTASAVPVSLWTFQPNTSTPTYVVQYGTSQPIGAHGSYTLALPSLNTAYWAVPDQLQVRLALAEAMSRPNLSLLAPTSTNNAINGTPTLDYSGTAGLKPIKSDQADLSVEWYYAPHSALAAALFGKKIRDDIASITTVNVDLGTLKYDGGPPGTVPAQKFLWTITAPVNGGTSNVKGLELTWQHILDMGLGARMQYTRTYVSGGVYAAPPWTISAELLYDKGPISASVNFDRQASYASYGPDSTDIPGWPAITDSFDWVTATARYKFWRGFEVYAEGRNLTNSIVRTYLNGNPLLPWAPGQAVGASVSGVGEGYSSYGRFYVLGLAWKF